MQKKYLLFWRNYPHKFLIYVFLSLAMFSLVVLLISRHWEYRWLYKWHTLVLTQKEQTSLEKFEQGLAEIDIQMPNFLQQYLYVASDLQIPIWASQVWWVLMLLAVSLLGTSISFFKRSYFLLASILMVVFIVMLPIHLVGIWGIYTKWFWGPLWVLLVVGVNYYFHAFGQSYSFLQRFIPNILLWLLLTVLVVFFAKEANPSLYIVGYGMLVPALVTVSTIFLVSSETPYLLARLTARQPKKITFHLFMLFYVANLFFLYLRNSKQLSADIFLVDDFYILALSQVVGFWGVRQNPLFQLIVPEKMRFWVYLGVILITNATLFYFNTVANEDAIAASEDFITYSHMGFGVAVWVYVTFNFQKVGFVEGVQNYSELFYGFQDAKPIPWYLARGLGFFLMGLVIYKENGITLNQSIAGYFTGLADVYLASNQTSEHLLAEQYYEIALERDLLCHRLWVSKAATLSNKNNEQASNSRISMFRQALQRDAQAFTYALLAQEYIDKNQITSAISYYRQGISKFPHNAFLLNNLAVLYSIEKKLDSAYFYLQKAQKYSLTPLEIQANLLSLLSMQGRLAKDSLDKISVQNDLLYQNNLLAAFNAHQQTCFVPFQLGFARKSLNDTSALNKNQLVYLYNHLSANVTDTLALYVAERLLETKQNLPYNDLLLQAKRNYFFKKNYHQQALAASGLLAYISASDYEYARIQHLIYLGQSWQAAKAIEKLQKSEFLAQSRADINYLWAVALSENRDLEEAIGLWQIIALDSLHPQRQKLARIMTQVHYADIQQWQKYSDSVRYGMIYYRIDLDLDKQIQIAQSIQDATLQAKAVAEIVHRLLKEAKIEEASSVFQWFSTVPKGASSEAKSQWLVARMKVAYLRNNIADLQALINGTSLSKRYKPYENFFKGVLQENSDSQGAYLLYQEAIWGNPYEVMFYPAIVKLANRLDSTPQGKAYEWALQATRFIELEARTWQLYFEQCVKAQFWEEAQEALKKIEWLAPQEFTRYKVILDEKKRS